MDVIVIQREDGSLVSSSFIVQFGILDIFKTKDKLIHISVNGKNVTDIKMRLFETGVAYFMPESEKKCNDSCPKAGNSDSESDQGSRMLRFNLTSLNVYHKASSALSKAFSKKDSEENKRPASRFFYGQSMTRSESTSSNKSKDESLDNNYLRVSDYAETQTPARRCSSLKNNIGRLLWKALCCKCTIQSCLFITYFQKECFRQGLHLLKVLLTFMNHQIVHLVFMSLRTVPLVFASHQKVF